MMDTSKEYIKQCGKAVKLQINTPPFHMQRTNNEIVYEDGEVWFHFWDGDEIKKTQLFRQDQLQEMLFGNMAEQWQRLFDFIAASPFPCSYFGSWEQLWLAFVMFEKFNKKWDGEDWIKGGIK